MANKICIPHWINVPISSNLSPAKKHLAAARDGRCRWRTWDDGGRYHQEVDASGAGPVAHQRNVLGVAAEQGDVLLDPVEHGYLVHQPVVGHASSRVWRTVGVQEACKQTGRTCQARRQSRDGRVSTENRAENAAVRPTCTARSHWSTDENRVLPFQRPVFLPPTSAVADLQKGVKGSGPLPLPTPIDTFVIYFIAKSF